MNDAGLDSRIRNFVRDCIGEVHFETIQLAGDASSRRYFRIVHGDESHVLMLWEPFKDDGRYPFLNVQAHFSKHGVHVPKVIGKEPSLGVILLEDLGDLTLERKFWESQNQKLSLPFYQQAVDELIKIHYSATKDSTSGCVAFSVSFNVEKLLWEMNYGREHLIEKLARVQLTDTERKSLDQVFHDICEYLHARPKHICHRDYHSRNLMLKLGKMRVIDFQDARMGPIQYDLVSLVHDSYVDINEETRQEILEYYLTQAKSRMNQPFSRDEFFQVFRVQILQRCFKACGSFASFYNMREDKRYLKYIGPTLFKVAQTLENFREYRDFLNILTDHGLLEIDYTDPTSIT